MTIFILALTFLSLHAELLASPPTPIVNPPPEAVLHYQETAVWCWAASAQMVMESLGVNHTQCEQASYLYLHQATGCPCQQCSGTSTVSPPCVDGGEFPQFAHFGFKYNCLKGTLPWCVLQPLLKAKKAVAFSWHWKINGRVRSGGHMMVAAATFTKDGVDFIKVLDPLCVCQGHEINLTYDEFNRGNDHEHWQDRYNFEPSAPGEEPLCSSVAPACEPASVPDMAKGMHHAKPVAVSKPAAAPAGEGLTKETLVKRFAEELLGKTLDTPDWLKRLHSYGLDTAGNAEQLKFPQPFRQVLIDSEELLSFEGGDPKRLLHQSEAWIFPVLTASGALQVNVREGPNRVVAFGAPEETRRLVDLRAIFAQKGPLDNNPDQEAVIVRIPGLNLSFLGRRTVGDVDLLPVCSDPSLRLREDQMVPLSQLLPKLQEMLRARRDNGPS